MIDKEGNIIDRREMLRVKIKSLAEEARIIRHEELRLKGGHKVRKPESVKAGFFLIEKPEKARKKVRKRRSRAGSWLFVELHQHRVQVVRAEARDTHIAYGLIRGMHYDRIEGGGTSPERDPRTDPRWASVLKMVKKYGPVGGMSNERLIELGVPKQVLQQPVLAVAA